MAQPLTDLVTLRCALNEAIIKKAKQLQTLWGKESAHSNRTAIHIVGENNKINIEGARYLTEINAQSQNLIDNKGYSYNYDSIPVEDLCTILDNQELHYQQVPNNLETEA